MINIEKYKTQSGAAKALAKALAKYALEVKKWNGFRSLNTEKGEKSGR